MSDPFVSVVVPVRDGEAHLRDCLASLQRLDYPRDRHEVVVVDNGSRDRTADIAHEFGVRCVHETAPGAANARNAGVAATQGDVVAFLDCDCRATSGWLREIAAAFAASSPAAVAGEIVSMPPRRATERYMARRKPLWAECTKQGRKAVHLGSANCAVRRSAIVDVGGFDARFRTAEDIDLSLRLRSAGHEIHHASRALVFHRHRSTLRGLASQQFGYGRGQALIARTHPDEFRWSFRAEVRAWFDVARSALRLVRVAMAREGATEHEALDLVRRAAMRIGFDTGVLAQSAGLMRGADR
jgi:cellulose synthase/poly-beta-1,6-N-acetylglucosamine synthase-like glycosyltransferase